MLVQYTGKTKKGKNNSTWQQIPLEKKKKKPHSNLSLSRYKSHKEQWADIWVYTLNTHGHRCTTFHPKHQQNMAARAIHVMCVWVCRTDSRVQYVWLTGCEQSTGAEPYLVATMPSQGQEQETLERGGNNQGMLNISWVGRHSAWWYKHMRRKRLAH